MIKTTIANFAITHIDSNDNIEEVVIADREFSIENEEAGLDALHNVGAMDSSFKNADIQLVEVEWGVLVFCYSEESFANAVDAVTEVEEDQE